MKDNLIFWRKKLKNNSSLEKKVAVVLTGFLVIALCTAGGGFYMKQVNDQKRAAENDRQKIKRSQDTITSFYRKAFSGVDLNQLPDVMREFERSRLPFSLTGFTETEYSCVNESCSFIYELNDMFVFSVTGKHFFNTDYEGNFTENTLNFENALIKSDAPRLLNNMNIGVHVDAVKCSDMLNYLYGYNSVVANPDRVQVSKLPFSSVSAAEQQLPSYKDSYGLMTGGFEAHVPDSFSDAYLFAEKNPYKDLFIVQSIEKSVKTGTDVILKGVFICKK